MRILGSGLVGVVRGCLAMGSAAAIAALAAPAAAQDPSPADAPAPEAVAVPDASSTPPAPSEPAPISAPPARTAEQAPPQPPRAIGRPAPPAPAAPSASPGKAVVLVLESSGGLRAASELRTALHQVGYRVLSPADARSLGQQPDALLTVAFTPPSAGGARAVHATYWARDGRADSLSAAALASLDQLNAVALALSSALIDRHKQDVSDAGAELARARMFADPRALYAMLSDVASAPRTNVRLRFEDF